MSKNRKTELSMYLNSQKFAAYPTKTGIFIFTKILKRWRANSLLVPTRCQNHTANTKLFPVATCPPREQHAGSRRNSKLICDSEVLLNVVLKLLRVISF